MVVTIVVLLILAGITITYVFGDNSIFNQASNAKLETELSKIEERASLIYSDKFVENKGGSVINREIVDKLIENGNNIEIRHVGSTAIKGISLEPEEISMDKNKTATIKVKIDGPEDENFYYAVIDGKYYKINFQGSQLTIEREATTPEGTTEESATIEVVTGYDETIVTKIKTNQSAKTIEIGSGTTYGTTTITVKYESKTADCKVTVEKVESDWAKIDKIAKEIAEGRTTKPVDHNSTEATVTVDGKTETIKVGESFYVKYDGALREVIVLGFNHDTLTNPTEAYGTGTTATKAGVSFQFKNFMMDNGHAMNSNKSNTYGWGGNPIGTNTSKMRTYLEGVEGIGKLSTTFQSKIKQVKKKYLLGNKSTTVLESDDRLWLLSCSEIFSGPTSYNTGGFGYAKAFEGDRYKYYINLKETDTSGHSGLIKKTIDGTGIAKTWWLRSPDYDGSDEFSCVNDCGNSYCFYANSSEIYVSPGFSI